MECASAAASSAVMRWNREVRTPAITKPGWRAPRACCNRSRVVVEPPEQEHRQLLACSRGAEIAHEKRPIHPVNQFRRVQPVERPAHGLAIGRGQVERIEAALKVTVHLRFAEGMNREGTGRQGSAVARRSEDDRHGLGVVHGGDAGAEDVIARGTFHCRNLADNAAFVQ